MVGLAGVEPATSPLSGVRSNQLSYRPKSASDQVTCVDTPPILDGSHKGGDPAAGSPTVTLLRLHPSHESQSGERPLLSYPLLLQPTPMV
jgi:hypothetical protein